MKADTRMRWLIEARNHIEHRGDLKTHSTAEVKVLAGVGGALHTQIEVPPLSGPAEIAEQIEIEGLPDYIRRDATLRVERRWVVDELPDDELLDAVAHCYGMIAEIVVEAHERAGTAMRTFGGETHAGRHERVRHPSGRLPCMVSTGPERTAFWHMGEGGLIEIEGRTRNADERSMEAAAQRYGDLILPAGQSDDALDQAAGWHNIGRQILATDGYHVPLALLIADRESELVVLTPEDQQGKHVRMEALAEDVARSGATAVLFSTEAWIAPLVPRRSSARRASRGAAPGPQPRSSSPIARPWTAGPASSRRRLRARAARSASTRWSETTTPTLASSSPCSPSGGRGTLSRRRSLGRVTSAARTEAVPRVA